MLLVELIVEGNADVEECIDGEVGAGDCQFLVVGVEFQKVEQRLYIVISTRDYCTVCKAVLTHYFRTSNIPFIVVCPTFDCIDVLVVETTR